MPVAALLCLLLAPAAAPAADPSPTYDVKATEAWRQKAEAHLREPYGWLSVSGLFFLNEGSNSVGSSAKADVRLPADAAPADAGRVVLDHGHVFFEPAPGVAPTLNGSPVSGRVELRGPDDATKRKADRLGIGRLQLHVHKSGDRLALRLRDPESALRREFTGMRWYPIDPSWVVRARFVKYPAPRTLNIQNVLGDKDTATSSGEVQATLHGHPLRLVAIHEDEDLWFVFSDATGTTGETYRIRFLYTGFPEADGTLLLDFNRVENPPCAYNEYTTCPLPPKENRVSFPIRAGERAYHH